MSTPVIEIKPTKGDNYDPPIPAIVISKDVGHAATASVVAGPPSVDGDLYYFGGPIDTSDIPDVNTAPRKHNFIRRSTDMLREDLIDTVGDFNLIGAIAAVGRYVIRNTVRIAGVETHDGILGTIGGNIKDHTVTYWQKIAMDERKERRLHDDGKRHIDIFGHQLRMLPKIKKYKEKEDAFSGASYYDKNQKKRTKDSLGPKLRRDKRNIPDGDRFTEIEKTDNAVVDDVYRIIQSTHDIIERSYHSPVQAAILSELLGGIDIMNGDVLDLERRSPNTDPDFVDHNEYMQHTVKILSQTVESISTEKKLRSRIDHLKSMMDNPHNANSHSQQELEGLINRLNQIRLAKEVSRSKWNDMAALIRDRLEPDHREGGRVVDIVKDGRKVGERVVDGDVVGAEFESKGRRLRIRQKILKAADMRVRPSTETVYNSTSVGFDIQNQPDYEVYIVDENGNPIDVPIDTSGDGYNPKRPSSRVTTKSEADAEYWSQAPPAGDIAESLDDKSGLPGRVEMRNIGVKNKDEFIQLIVEEFDSINESWNPVNVIGYINCETGGIAI